MDGGECGRERGGDDSCAPDVSGVNAAREEVRGGNATQGGGNRGAQPEEGQGREVPQTFRTEIQ